MQASITDIFQFLKLYAPADLERLAARHPESTAYFHTAGTVLGDGEEQALSDAALTMLSALADTATTASASVSKKLASARKLELMGSILSLLSSGGVVGAALGRNDLWTAAGLGLVAFLANAVPLIVNWLRGSPTGSNVSQGLVQLRQCAWEAQLLRANLKRNNKWNEEAEGIVREVNELGRKAYSVLNDLGFEHTLRPI